jgi:DNA invertase Pin-like site-specific DNA recombinase
MAKTTPKPSLKLIPYCRVSTAKQGRSGLGLDGQMEAVNIHAQAVGGKVVLPPYVEVESGKRNDRPELAKALAACKAMRAVLCVAKLDRLSRDVEFVAGVMNSGVEFVACDNPTANRLTLHILAAVAENEAKAISERTKAALAAYKARGGELGATLPQCRNLTNKARAKGRLASIEARRQKAIDTYAAVRPLLLEWRAEGRSLRAMADELNRSGYLTSRGGHYSQVQVRTILATK